MRGEVRGHTRQRSLGRTHLQENGDADDALGAIKGI